MDEIENSLVGGWDNKVHIELIRQPVGLKAVVW